MTVLVPPAIFHEMEAILHLPVIADQTLKIAVLDLVGIEAADIETRIVRL